MKKLLIRSVERASIIDYRINEGNNTIIRRKNKNEGEIIIITRKITLKRQVLQLEVNLVEKESP